MSINLSNQSISWIFSNKDSFNTFGTITAKQIKLNKFNKLKICLILNDDDKNSKKFLQTLRDREINLIDMMGNKILEYYELDKIDLNIKKPTNEPQLSAIFKNIKIKNQTSITYIENSEFENDLLYSLNVTLPTNENYISSTLSDGTKIYLNTNQLINLLSHGSLSINIVGKLKYSAYKNSTNDESIYGITIAFHVSNMKLLITPYLEALLKQLLPNPTKQIIKKTKYYKLSDILTENVLNILNKSNK